MAYLGYIFPRLPTPFAHSNGVVIRTNSAFTVLTVNAANDTVKHFGTANVINVTAVAMGSSYHEYGSVATLNVKAGEIAVESNAFVGKVAVASSATASTVTVQNNGTIFATEVVTYTVNETTGDVTIEEYTGEATEANTLVDAVGTQSTDDVLRIGNADALINLASAQSQGMISYLKIELTADINLTGKTWIPFGQNQSHSFEGTIDGKNHSIIGLNGNGATATEQFVSTTAQVAGNAYGLIAYARGSVTIKNLTMKDVEINLTGSGNGVGALIGVATYKESNTEKMLFENVKVYGNICSTDKVGGFVGTTKHTDVMPGTMYDNILLEFNNCENYANISAENTTSARAGGFIGAAYNEKFTNCKNYGNVSATGNSSNGASVGAGVLVGCFNFGSGNLDYNQFIISGCTNFGSVSATNNDANTKPTVSGCKNKSWLLNNKSVNWPAASSSEDLNQTYFNENASEMTTFTLSGNGNK